jgi:hypothetical protein
MNTVLHPSTGKEMQYKDIMKHPLLGPSYKRGFGNELGRLCQGIRDIKGTNTYFFVELKNIPKDRQITYGKLVCDHEPKSGTGTGEINSWRRQAGLLRRSGNISRRYHSFQNLD